MIGKRFAAVVAAVLGLLPVGSCATTRAVRPLGRSNAAFSASAGGPLLRVSGVDIATPIVMVGEAYGTRDDLDVFANVDLTAAAYGDLHVQPGLAYHPLVRDAGAAPTLTVAGSAHLATDFDAFRTYPQLTLTAAWLIHHRHQIYLGGDGVLGFGSTTRLIAGPLVGGELRVGRLGLALEAKWLAAYYDVAPTAPSWLSPWGHGYLGVLFGVTTYTESIP